MASPQPAKPTGNLTNLLQLEGGVGFDVARRLLVREGRPAELVQAVVIEEDGRGLHFELLHLCLVASCRVIMCLPREVEGAAPVCLEPMRRQECWGYTLRP